MSDDDDFDDRTTFPILVKVAGFLWVGFGALGLIGTILQLVNAGGGGKGSLFCGGIIAFAFLYVGFQTIKGDAKDTLGNSIGSILLGLLYIALAAALAFFLGNAGGIVAPNEALFLGGLVGAIGMLLIGAGAMALSGRQQYQQWRRENKMPKRRRREREDEIEDDLDR